MARIFISYRRSDTITITGRIHDKMVMEFGDQNVFKDVDDIPLGADFRTVLDNEVGLCDVQLVIIGPQWVNAMTEDESLRLDDPDDFVRIEVESGLRRDDVLVIPVLVKSAGMPNSADLPTVLRELAYRNAAIIRDDPDFHRDMSRLFHQIRQHMTEVDARSAPTAPKVKAAKPPARQPAKSRVAGSSVSNKWIAIGGAIAVIAVATILLLLSRSNEPGDPGEATPLPPTEPDETMPENVAVVPSEFPPVIAVILDAEDEATRLDIARGVELALHERSVVYVGEGEYHWDINIMESECSPEESRQIAEIVVGDSLIVGVIGHSCNQSCDAAGEIYDANSFTTISPACDAPELIERGFHSFNRLVASPSIPLPQTAADFAYHDLGVHRVVVLHDENDYSIEAMNLFADEFQGFGGEIVEALSFDSDEKTLVSVVERIFELSPDLVYFGGNADNAAQLVSSASSFADHGVKFLYGNGDDKHTYVANSDGFAEGTYVTYLATSDIDEDFRERFEAAHGESPQTLNAMYAYDATDMLLDAIEVLGIVNEEGMMQIDRTHLQEYIRSYEGEGFSGRLYCADNGECGSGQAVLYQYIGGEFIEIADR